MGPAVPDRWAAGIVLVALVLGAALVLVFDAPGTDEDDYMPFALGDLLGGRNPYATHHEQARTVGGLAGGWSYEWATTYPYLPLLAVLQVPGVDYRWTALLAYALLLWALRTRMLAFALFANLPVLWLAASGFNDFVVLALLAWADRTGKGWPAWLASGAKQLALPLVALDAALRGEPRRLVAAAAVAAVVTLPFVLWDPAAFWQSAVEVHLRRVGPGVAVHHNYFLYVLYAVAVTVPSARAARAAARAASPGSPRRAPG